MHNYGETSKTAIQSRLINSRFTGNLQHWYGCILKSGQIHLTRPLNPRWRYSTQGDFKTLLISTFSDFAIKFPYYVWLLMFCFFSMWVFLHEHSRITELQGKGEGISSTPHSYFHPLYRHLDISRAIIAENSPLHIASSRTRTGNLCFPSASR